jgi:hypothetical protein
LKNDKDIQKNSTGYSKKFKYRVSKKIVIWSFLAKNFLQNDSLEVFLGEKSIARIEKP